MRAITISHDKPHAYRLTELPMPEPGEGEVLLRMHAASLNFRDRLFHSMPVSDYGGDMRGKVPLSDGVGIVEAVGSGVSGWKVGDRLCPLFFPNWTSGQPSAERIATALGAERGGGVCAEFVVARQESVVAAPPHLTHAEAASLVCAGLTAWVALFEYGRLQRGHTVLLQGTGGVSVIALQLALSAGARVIMTSSSDEKLERARALGATETINYREEPQWGLRARELTDGRGVDHIVEVAGGATLPQSFEAAGMGCSISMVGVLSGAGGDLPPGSINAKMLHAHGVFVGSRDQFERMNDYLTCHLIHPIIGARFAMADAENAIDLLGSGRHFGKIALDIA